MRGKDTLPELTNDWRLGGTLIDHIAEPGQRREAFNIMLSMPRGTDPLSVMHAAREFVKIELADHKYVMVLHDHQANPHVHIRVMPVALACTKTVPQAERTSSASWCAPRSSIPATRHASRQP